MPRVPMLIGFQTYMAFLCRKQRFLLVCVLEALLVSFRSIALTHMSDSSLPGIMAYMSSWTRLIEQTVDAYHESNSPKIVVMLNVQVAQAETM